MHDPDVIKTLLVEAKALIKDPQKWTKAAYARNARDQAVIFSSPRACKWCALGAIKKIAHEHELTNFGEDSLYGYLVQASNTLDSRGVSTVNDLMGHGAVMAMFDLAIAKLDLK